MWLLASLLLVVVVAGCQQEGATTVGPASTIDQLDTKAATLAPVNLRSSGTFLILSKSGISTTGTTKLTGPP